MSTHGASLFPDQCVYLSSTASQAEEGHSAVVAIFTRLRHSHDPPGSANDSDAILVRRALLDRESFAALYQRYIAELGRFCLLRLHDEEAARDATQQIFAQALEAVDPGMTPEEMVTATLERHTLLAAVSRLPDDQRTALELRMAGLTGPEVAAAMGRSHEAIKKLQLRGLQRLRADLVSRTDAQVVRRGA